MPEKGGRTGNCGTLNLLLSPASVWEPFKSHRCFVMEADQTAVNPRDLMAMAMLPEGKTLPGLVPADVWTKVQARLGSQVPAPVLGRSQPWFATLLYLQSIVPKGEPMDGAFLTRARAQKKRLEFLEDWREAISAFASVTGPDDLTDIARRR